MGKKSSSKCLKKLTEMLNTSYSISKLSGPACMCKLDLTDQCASVEAGALSRPVVGHPVSRGG